MKVALANHDTSLIRRTKRGVKQPGCATQINFFEMRGEDTFLPKYGRLLRDLSQVPHPNRIETERFGHQLKEKGQDVALDDYVHNKE